MGRQRKRKVRKIGPPPSLNKKAGAHALRQLSHGWTADGLFREICKIDHSDAERTSKHPGDSDAFPGKPVSD
jgi:hypothetical protein